MTFISRDSNLIEKLKVYITRPKFKITKMLDLNLRKYRYKYTLMRQIFLKNYRNKKKKLVNKYF